MNSKKKNKNRQSKPANPTPPQKQEVSEPSSLPEVTSTEAESVFEERVPNIVSENVTTEVKETEETPKKPKRNRGKKKKEDEKSDKEEEVQIEESIPETGLSPVKDSLNEANITPTARKKKNKNKKGQGEHIEKTEIEKEVHFDQRSAQPQETAVTKIEEPESEVKPGKKKNKKKKNRNDSEKSEKAEEISCTSAFQKLLAEDGNAKSVPQPPTGDSNISEATVKETKIISQANLPTDIKPQDTSERDEGNKNKKKNKKDKKPPTDPSLLKAAELGQPLKTKEVENISIPSNVPDATSGMITKDTIKTLESAVLPSTSTADEQNSKQKAKIAKPVDKKKKGKSYDKNSEENVEKEALEIKSENAEEMKFTETESKQETSITAIEDLDDVILVPLTDFTPDWQEEVKIEEGNGPVIGCDEKIETAALKQPVGSLEKKKNRKKSPKPPIKTEIQGTSDISSTTSQFEEILPKTSSEQAVEKPDIKLERNPEIKLEEKDKVEHVPVVTDTEKKNDRRTSPKPPSPKPPTTQISTDTLTEIHTSGNIVPDTKFEKKEDDKVEIQSNAKHGDQVEVKPEETAPSSEDKNELVKAGSSNQKKNRKKSPKPPKINEAPIPVTSFETVQSETTHTPSTTLLKETSCADISSLKSEELFKTKHGAVTTDIQKDNTERVKTPDSEKRQKNMKSSKPVVDIASGSKCTQKSGQNVLNIDDIIIIQAEVVSEDKAQKSDSFIAIKDATDNQEKVQKIYVKRDTEKSKKRKKSPKPPQKDNAKEVKDDTDKTCTLEPQPEIQIPVTPITSDKMLPETIAVELDTPKLDAMSSPSEATPDFIEYPRCSSEHLDSNNNMIIQDISHSETKLEAPIVLSDMPLIAAGAVKLIDIKSENKPAEEKTDLKSKVMEVNQDMEELRLSIERSLAELTSLDKADKDAESTAKGKSAEITDTTKDTHINPELPVVEKRLENVPAENTEDFMKPTAEANTSQEPICPARKDHKGKTKSKKKGKQESVMQNPPTQSSQQTTTDPDKTTQSQDSKKEDTNKTEQKSGDAQGKETQQSSQTKGNKDDDLSSNNVNEKSNRPEFEPIENFEDAMTSSVDDVNKTFEMIVNEGNPRLNITLNNPEINVIAPQEDDKNSRQDKQNPVSPPKNLLGHPDIPVPSNRTDYKKEKNKPPNHRQAKVKIKDANQVQIEIPEKSKESKESQTESKRKFLNYKIPDESICVTNQNDDYVYKYSFRKVFLQCACHVCKKDLKQTRVPCSYCNLIFYCNQKHKDEDYTQHQALCFAVSTIVHLKDQKFIYADAQDITGHNYRLLRMQMIVSCEKLLKRRLSPWEQEALLYPRMCGYSSCREWRQGKLVDCEGCGQISYCADNPDHLPKTHSRWCKSYNLYRALVKYQQTQGRLEPKLPTKVVDLSPLPDNINEVLAFMYEEKIDMSDIEYAALTQIATAPLTALFCLQNRPSTTNGITKKTTLTVHIVGAELQFEADVLIKWEVFLLHLVPDVKELRVVLVGPDLNPSNLPLELLGKIKFCENCRQNKRRVVFGFQDKRTYHEFWASEDFTAPDLVCAFNPSIQRSSTYNGKDTWPSTINCILKLKTLFAITSYTLSELTSDLLRVQECADVGYNVVLAPKNNSFSSVRPDRNFISDDEAPLLFKNHCVTVLCGI